VVLAIASTRERERERERESVLARSAPLLRASIKHIKKKRSVEEFLAASPIPCHQGSWRLVGSGIAAAYAITRKEGGGKGGSFTGRAGEREDGG
jgi:hypothetical protein